MEIELSPELSSVHCVAAGMPGEVCLLVLGRRRGGCQVLPFLLLPLVSPGLLTIYLCGVSLLTAGTVTWIVWGWGRARLLHSYFSFYHVLVIGASLTSTFCWLVQM